MTPKHRWRRAEVAVLEDGQRSVVLPLALDDPRPIVLNGSAALVWEALQEEGTADEVAATIAAQVDVDVATIHQDVEEFIAELATFGLAVRLP